MSARTDPQRRKLMLTLGAPAAVFVYCLVPDRLVGWPLDETMVDLFEWLYLHRPSIANMRDLLASARLRDR